MHKAQNIFITWDNFINKNLVSDLHVCPTFRAGDNTYTSRSKLIDTPQI